jgi:hypothetical protein
MSREILALGPRFGLVLGIQGKVLWLPGVAVWAIFEFLGGRVTYSSYQVKPTTRIFLYRHLWVYIKKDSSAWTEVWSISWPSRASITAPGGRGLGDF